MSKCRQQRRSIHICVFRGTSERWKLYQAKSLKSRSSSFDFWIFTEQSSRGEKQRGGKQVWGISCCSPGGIEPCIQSTGLCEVFFTRLDQKTRMSSNAGCYITQLDSSHSLIHFSAYLYPFNSRDLTTPPPSQVGTQTRQTNNLRTEAAQLLRENKWRCMQCVKDSSELNPNQSSTYYWCNVVVGKGECTIGCYD